jgi:uncharacterized protein (TIGR03437 family)
MKHLAVFFVAAGLSFAGNFVTGQAARAVIGQSNFTVENPTSSDTVVGGVGGLAYANGTLFVVDSNQLGATPVNNRVLIFNNMSKQLPGLRDTVPQNSDIQCPLCTGKADVVLGQSDFSDSALGLTQQAMAQPTAVATDGQRLAVADTNNNRILIWTTIPSTNNDPADLVIGQPDFTSNCPNATGPGVVGGAKACPDVRSVNAKGLRGPAGVWIQNGKLFVADTLNDRVLIWNQFPTQNFQPADVVLGQPNFTTSITDNMADPKQLNPQATTLSSPVGVSSDGQHLFVADLGQNRVLIWNRIPTQNQAPADVVVGQPSMTTAIADYTGSGGVCAPTSQDSSGNNIYPARCAATLDFPRFVISDGARMFIADGGADRVLVFNSIPTQNGASADAVLGQPDEYSVLTSDDTSSPYLARRGAADALRTPVSLAWDGENLYVSDPFDRRILVFAAGDTVLESTAIRNAASMNVYATGAITLGGTITENDQITVTIDGNSYSYKATKDDTLGTLTTNLAAAINANGGDANVIALDEPSVSTILLTARAAGTNGNNVTYSATVTPTSSQITISAMGGSLSGGGDAAKIAEGSLISIFGTNLADAEAYPPAGADPLPTNLGGVRVYIDGMEAPLLAVTPGQINAQMPYEFWNTTSVSAYVRTEHADGSVTVTNPVAVTVVAANPGIFAMAGDEPRTAIAVHSSSSATGLVLISGSNPNAGDTATIVIDGTNYTYTAQTGDTLDSVRDGLVQVINDNAPTVRAEAAGGAYQRIILHARVDGPDGNGITYGTLATGNISLSTVTATDSGDATLCCANIAGALITDDNPAQPGEIITLYATGLGQLDDNSKGYVWTGHAWQGPAASTTAQEVTASAGTMSANVLYSSLVPGTVGLYRVDLMLNPGVATNPKTQVTISQNMFVSNVVTISVLAPPPPDSGN